VTQTTQERELAKQHLSGAYNSCAASLKQSNITCAAKVGRNTLGAPTVANVGRRDTRATDTWWPRGLAEQLHEGQRERKLLQATHKRAEYGRQEIEGCGRQVMRKDYSCRWRVSGGKQRMRQCGKEDTPVGSREGGGSLRSLMSLLISDALLKSSAREISLAARPMESA
jgi:hypothetical protein